MTSAPRVPRTTLAGVWCLSLLACTASTAALEQDLPEGTRSPAAGLCFQSASTYAVGASPWGITSGDFNEDGRADLAVSNYDSGTVTVLLSTGASFQSAGSFPVLSPPVTGLPRGLAAGDLNGDGHLDLAVAEQVDGPSVLFGTGTGQFGAPVSLGGGSGFRLAVIGDFNGDGLRDIAGRAGGVVVWLGVGGGSFGTPSSYGADDNDLADGLALGDFDGNGIDDLAFANFNSYSAGVLLGSAQGFSSATYASGYYALNALGVGDVNGDGRQDLVASTASSDLLVWLGTGSGAFGSYTAQVGANSSVSAVRLADFDSDGYRDLAMSEYCTSCGAKVLPGTAAGFGGAVSYTTGSSPERLTLGDFNADGRSDFATANYGSNNVSVFLNCATGALPPVVTTGAVTGIGYTGGMLHGTVNPRGSATSAYFQWGPTTTYGNNTPTQNLGSGSSVLPLSADLSTATCNTSYHVRAVATNAGGTTVGNDVTFTTAA